MSKSIFTFKNCVEKKRFNENNITKSEWQTYFRFAPSTELEASLRSWRRGVQLDMINEQQMPNSYTEKERKNGFYSRHFIAGALSGMVSRPVTVPLDRLKIYMQAMGKKKLLNTATYDLTDFGEKNDWLFFLVQMVEGVSKVFDHFDVVTVLQYLKWRLKWLFDRVFLKHFENFLMTMMKL
jgi:hypothetical protein